MTNWQFNNEMIDILRRLKGKTLISFETDNLAQGESYGSLRINTNDNSVLLQNEEEELAMLECDMVAYEEASRFSCKEVDSSSTFTPNITNCATIKHKINEKIAKVSIITDIITGSDKSMDISIDMAVVLETESHKYSFSKSECWFDEVIYFNIDKNFDDTCPISAVVSTWNNDDELDITVERQVTEL